MNYKHTQIWYLTISLLTTTVIFLILLVIKANFQIQIATIIMVIIVIIIIASFTHLTVKVTDEKLKLKFGCWIFKKSFNISEISSVKQVKNHWYYWWGIRVWFWPYMWIYNISGFDAVEIIMDNWRIYRIWTDENEKLEKAISEKLKK